MRRASLSQIEDEADRLTAASDGQFLWVVTIDPHTMQPRVGYDTKDGAFPVSPRGLTKTDLLAWVTAYRQGLEIGKTIEGHTCRLRSSKKN